MTCTKIHTTNFDLLNILYMCVPPEIYTPYAPTCFVGDRGPQIKMNSTKTCQQKPEAPTNPAKNLTYDTTNTVNNQTLFDKWEQEYMVCFLEGVHMTWAPIKIFLSPVQTNLQKNWRGTSPQPEHEILRYVLILFENIRDCDRKRSGGEH